MDNNLISYSSTNNGNIDLKKMWKMPGGKLAAISGVGIIGVAVYYLFKIMPFLVAGAANTFVFILELFAIAVLLMMFTSKTFWKALNIMWFSCCRSILGFFVKISPIDILENGIRRMNAQLEVVEENITKLGGVLEQMKRDERKYENEFKENVARREAAQKALNNPKLTSEQALEMKSQFVIINNNITRLQATIAASQKRIQTSEKYLSVLRRLRIVSKMKVADTTNELEFRKREFDAAKKQNSAMKSIKAIFSGGLGKTLEEEMALDYVNETVTNSIAEMQSLLDGSQELLVNFDLDNIAALQKADDIIAQFEKNGFKSFNNDPNDAQEVPYTPMAEQMIEAKSQVTAAIDVNTISAEPEKVPVERKSNTYF